MDFTLSIEKVDKSRPDKCRWRRSAHKELKERLALTQGVTSKRVG